MYAIYSNVGVRWSGYGTHCSTPIYALKTLVSWKKSSQNVFCFDSNFFFFLIVTPFILIELLEALLNFFFKFFLEFSFLLILVISFANFVRMQSSDLFTKEELLEMDKMSLMQSSDLIILTILPLLTLSECNHLIFLRKKSS